MLIPPRVCESTTESYLAWGESVASRAGRPPRVSPFLIAGGGFFIHSERFPAETFRSTEGAFVGGGGVRVQISPRVYAMGDFRMGWEPHVRATGGIGLSM